MRYYCSTIMQAIALLIVLLDALKMNVSYKMYCSFTVAVYMTLRTLQIDNYLTLHIWNATTITYDPHNEHNANKYKYYVASFKIQVIENRFFF